MTAYDPDRRSVELARGKADATKRCADPVS
jgi:hypothetical protein